MINGWSIPAVWIFVVAQASAAVWWASGTDQDVTRNSVSDLLRGELERDLIDYKELSELEKMRWLN